MDTGRVEPEPVSCDQCLLCQLNSTDRNLVTERLDSGQGTVADVICKHFWLSAATCTGRYICTTCWDVTYSFHKFYLEVERLHSPLDPAAVKQEPPAAPTQTKQQADTTKADQLVWLNEGSTLITNVNEVFVKESLPESDDEPAEEDEDSDEDANIPLATLKQAAKPPATKTLVPLQQDDDGTAGNAPFPGVGLSLCRISGSSLELLCHDCYRKSNNANSSERSKEGARFTFAALLKHYRQVHGKPGYAVCCNRKYTRRRSLKMHLQTHGRKLVYRCVPCGIKFRKQESLDEHNLLIHTSEEEKRYRCDKCDKAFATEHLLNSHGLWHENVARKNITCSVCNIFFTSQPSLKKHRALHHPSMESSDVSVPSTNGSTAEAVDDEKLVASQYRTRISATEIGEQEKLIRRHCLLHCSRCAFFGESFTQLKEHAAEAHGLRSCDVVCCERTYSKRQSLYEHCLVHENPDCFRCDVCGKSYSSSRSLQNHKWRIHTPAAERPFRCDVCGETFVKDYLLKQHLVHHLAKHKKLNHCDVCERSFTTATVLKCHQQTYHGGGFALICDICAKGFNSRALFENHRLTHSVEGKSQLKHQCEQCKKWLRNKKSYQQHRIRCHTNDGPVTCKFCGKESVNASALKSHVHLHHAARPEYPCTLCDKRFKTALRLREHEATHTGTALYRCPWCPRTFACGSNMYKHKKAGHPLEWAASVKQRFGER
ncbi:zinc finger protein 845 [Anopheles gambiae]|uniref:zinc finger protein 845 n=1 Tax=Anopheles gambiae TaxID=7165 RepID=UPI002AC907B4|nr:zinc finger protein 845 [Anopheles gambiae]